MKKNDLPRILGILCGLICIIATTGCVVYFFTIPEEGLLNGAGTKCFMYFTVDSNILCALTFLPALYFALKDRVLPRWASRLRLAGTVSVGVTLLVVLVLLGPRWGYIRMFSGSSFWLHGVCPVLAILSYCFFEKHPVPGFDQILIGILPAFIYAIVYLCLAVFLKVWDDFYGFNPGGRWPIFFVAIMGAAALIAAGLIAVRRGMGLRRKA